MDLHSHLESDFVTHRLEGSNQAYPFINSIVVPRPIAFITTVGAKGIVNAAPFSYFNVVCNQPVILSVAIQKKGNERKDTARNILAHQEFVVNICSENLAKAVSIAGQDFSSDISEIDQAGLQLLPSQCIKVPRIANTLVQLECKLSQVIEISQGRTDLILGEVVMVHLHKEILCSEGRVEISKLNPLARLAGRGYAKLKGFFEVH